MAEQTFLVFLEAMAQVCKLPLFLSLVVWQSDLVEVQGMGLF